MANYDNIKVSNLRNAINNILNRINENALDNALNTLKGPNYWESNCKQVFLNALEEQKDTNYRKLLQKLEDYLTIANYIESWQTLNDNNTDLAKKRDAAYDKIYTKKYRYKKDQNGEYVYDAWGNHVSEAYTEYSQRWNDKYKDYVNKINNNKSTMQDYEVKIKSLI